MKRVLRLRQMFAVLTLVIAMVMNFGALTVRADDPTPTPASSGSTATTEIVSTDDINDMFTAPAESDDMLKDVTKLAKNGGKSVVNLVRFIAIAVFIVYIIIVAIKFATGDPAQRAKNRENLAYLFVGILIFALSAALFAFANTIAGAIASALQ